MTNAFVQILANIVDFSFARRFTRAESKLGRGGWSPPRPKEERGREQRTNELASLD
jgi:hypothetical protein